MGLPWMLVRDASSPVHVQPRLAPALVTSDGLLHSARLLLAISSQVRPSG